MGHKNILKCLVLYFFILKLYNMGHYYSEMSGPPFDFCIPITLTDNEYEKAKQLILKQKIYCEMDISKITVVYKSITIDKTRKWFEWIAVDEKYVKSSSCYGGNIVYLNEKKVFKKKQFLEFDKQLEDRRNKILKKD